MSIQKLSPVLIVESVKPCLDFWIDRLGFSLGHQVPGDDGALVFGSVTADGVELMYQTRASVLAEEDGPARETKARELTGHSVALFFEVSDIDAFERAVAGAPVVKARHQTFYGTTEIYVKEPGGNVIGFSAPTG